MDSGRLSGQDIQPLSGSRRVRRRTVAVARGRVGDSRADLVETTAESLVQLTRKRLIARHRPDRACWRSSPVIVSIGDSLRWMSDTRCGDTADTAHVSSLSLGGPSSGNAGGVRRAPHFGLAEAVLKAVLPRWRDRTR